MDPPPSFEALRALLARLSLTAAQHNSMCASSSMVVSPQRYIEACGTKPSGRLEDELLRERLRLSERLTHELKAQRRQLQEDLLQVQTELGNVQNELSTLRLHTHQSSIAPPPASPRTVSSPDPPPQLAVADFLLAMPISAKPVATYPSDDHEAPTVSLHPLDTSVIRVLELMQSGQLRIKKYIKALTKRPTAPKELAAKANDLLQDAENDYLTFADHLCTFIEYMFTQMIASPFVHITEHHPTPAPRLKVVDVTPSVKTAPPAESEPPAAARVAVTQDKKAPVGDSPASAGPAKTTELPAVPSPPSASPGKKVTVQVAPAFWGSPQPSRDISSTVDVSHSPGALPPPPKAKPVITQSPAPPESTDVPSTKDTADATRHLPTRPTRVLPDIEVAAKQPHKAAPPPKAAPPKAALPPKAEPAPKPVPAETLKPAPPSKQLKQASHALTTLKKPSIPATASKDMPPKPSAPVPAHKATDRAETKLNATGLDESQAIPTEGSTTRIISDAVVETPIDKPKTGQSTTALTVSSVQSKNAFVQPAKLVTTPKVPPKNTTAATDTVPAVKPEAVAVTPRSPALTNVAGLVTSTAETTTVPNRLIVASMSEVSPNKEAAEHESSLTKAAVAPKVTAPPRTVARHIDAPATSAILTAPTKSVDDVVQAPPPTKVAEVKQPIKHKHSETAKKTAKPATVEPLSKHAEAVTVAGVPVKPAVPKQAPSTSTTAEVPPKLTETVNHVVATMKAVPPLPTKLVVPVKCAEKAIEMPVKCAEKAIEMPVEPMKPTDRIELATPSTSAMEMPGPPPATGPKVVPDEPKNAVKLVAKAVERVEESAKSTALLQPASLKDTSTLPIKAAIPVPPKSAKTGAEEPLAFTIPNDQELPVTGGAKELERPAASSAPIQTSTTVPAIRSPPSSQPITVADEKVTTKTGAVVKQHAHKTAIDEPKKADDKAGVAQETAHLTKRPVEVKEQAGSLISSPAKMRKMIPVKSTPAATKEQPRKASKAKETERRLVKSQAARKRPSEAPTVGEPSLVIKRKGSGEPVVNVKLSEEEDWWSNWWGKGPDEGKEPKETSEGMPWLEWLSGTEDAKKPAETTTEALVAAPAASRPEAPTRTAPAAKTVPAAEATSWLSGWIPESPRVVDVTAQEEEPSFFDSWLGASETSSTRVSDRKVAPIRKAGAAKAPTKTAPPAPDSDWMSWFSSGNPSPPPSAEKLDQQPQSSLADWLSFGGLETVVGSPRPADQI